MFIGGLQLLTVVPIARGAGRLFVNACVFIGVLRRFFGSGVRLTVCGGHISLCCVRINVLL